MDEHAPAPDGGRMPSIDVLRGVAIAWVVLFHLWGDIEFFPAVPRVYYEQLADQVREGTGMWPVFTAFSDLIFRKGFQGVPLFMMISGLSLTIAAYRVGDSWRWRPFFGARFRKLLVPYLAGVALTYAVIAGIAARQASLGWGSFADQFTGGITISEKTLISIDPGVMFASVTLLPRLLNDEWFFAPQLALWFVALLAQYYLLFPVLFLAMRRIGVAPFLLATFAFTVAANAWVVREYGVLELKFFLVTGWAPFRLFEFTAGMGLGWLIASPERARALDFFRHPAAIAGCLAAGLAVHISGDLLIGWWDGEALLARDASLYWQALALPLVTLGLGLLVLPLLVQRPGRVYVSSPMRALALLGVMSYAVLIVSDAMRLVASQLRVEQIPDPAWWFFLVAVYVPVTVAIAWPLSHALGLMPKRRTTVPPQYRRGVAPQPGVLAPEVPHEDAPAPGVLVPEPVVARTRAR